jgi:hypothetical protein
LIKKRKIKNIFEFYFLTHFTFFFFTTILFPKNNEKFSV